MTTLPLRLGRLEVAGYKTVRSGFRWLCSDGHVCRPNEIVAYCNIALRGGDPIFVSEAADFQVALASRIAGRVRYAATASLGGYLDRLPTRHWREDDVWATLEDAATGEVADADEPELLFLAGRRLNGITENTTGLLTGWHGRTRAWWGSAGHQTILGVGICEMDALFRGNDGHFGGMLEARQQPTQLVLSQGDPLVPCARVLTEQFLRSPADIEAIRDDLATGVLPGGAKPGAEEWIFAGALLDGLEHAPLREEYQLLGRSGLCRAGPAESVCLSLNAEMARVPVHRQLGYALNFHNYRLAAVGPAIRGWLQSRFEFQVRTVDDVAADYRRLIAAAPGRRFFVINRFSSQHYETVQSYHGMTADTLDKLSTRRARDLNLMIAGLAQELPNLEVVDADAVAAELGMYVHVSDGIHGSGRFYDEVRKELLRLVGATG